MEALHLWHGCIFMDVFFDDDDLDVLMGGKDK